MMIDLPSQGSNLIGAWSKHSNNATYSSSFVANSMAPVDDHWA